MEDTSQVTITRTSMPVAAGILSIISGSIHISLGCIIVFMGQQMVITTGFWGMGILWIPLITIGLISLIGGIYAIKRKAWGMVLTGAITALVWPLSALGVAAIILVVLSKHEFDKD